MAVSWLNKVVAWLRAAIASEPVLVAWLLNGGLVVIAAYLLHFTHTQEAAAATILTALTVIWTSLRTVPVNVTAITGALATVLTAIAAFGYSLSAGTISAIVTAAGLVLSLLLRSHLTPRRPVVQSQLPEPLPQVAGP